jgi:2,3-bisphosphoglycerate-dependent phosphoglycerate mutase
MSDSERILVLLRHGESVWNRENRFTGWTDVALTNTGHEQARRSGEQLRQAGIVPSVAHTSVLQRAIHTLEEVLDRLDGARPPIRYAWELNERHYGRLQGKNKAETEREFGPDKTLAWRRSFADPPPPVALDDPRHPRFDERYAKVPGELLPRGESLRDTAQRVIPYWDREIVPDLVSGPVLVVAHGNSLRSLVMHLEGIGPAEIQQRNIPTGIPLVYRLDGALTVLGQRYLAGEQELADGIAKAIQRP